MKIKYTTMIITAVATMLFVVPPVSADDKDKKKDGGVVDRIREADPPKASTGTVNGSGLQPYDGHKSEPKFKEPPPPKVEKKKDDKK